ncbi:hypothetical protein PYCC9005_001048 [Savitreella phatthalungensis]
MSHTAQQLSTPYPVIDTDPHFFRVIRYARWSDWAYMAGLASGFPALMALWERSEPTMSAKYARSGAMASVMRTSWSLGAIGGFLYAYNRSQQRFWGWRENQPEQERDLKELSARVADGKSVYGESELSPYMQTVAARNSTYSGLLFGLIPWFNLVNHPHHGVDTAKYGEQRKE